MDIYMYSNSISSVIGHVIVIVTERFVVRNNFSDTLILKVKCLLKD